MALQKSVTVRNAELNAIETAMGGTVLLRIYDLTAGAPANCAAAITGGTLVTITCPADYFAAADGGTIVKAGTWEDASADAAGTADFWRIYDNAGTTCHLQGTASQTAGGGDLTLDNAVIAAAQKVTIATFSIVAGNA